jgi:hypothetical protein
MRLSKELEIKRTDTSEIEKLLKQGVLGFYNSVEVTEIFAILPDKNVVNVFTIIVSEFKKNVNFDDENYLVKNPFKLSKGLKGWRFGIKRYRKRVDDIINALDKLTRECSWEASKNALKVAKLEYCPKRFVAPDSFEEIPLNKVLKNNFHNGCYVLEWFDHQKKVLSPILEKPILLQELSSEIQEYVPICLAPLSDRVGNFILQIPSNIMQARFSSLNKSEDLQCNIAWHPDAIKRDVLVNCSLDENDKLLEGYASKAIRKDEDSITFSLGYQKAHIGVIWDPEHEVLLAATRPSSFINSIHMSSNIIQSENRIIPSSNGEILRIGLLNNQQSIFGGQQEAINQKDWTKSRIYKNDKLQLHKSKHFIQYKPQSGKKHINRSKALTDIRELINQYGDKGVWLWDPYLSSQDILDTLFHNKYMHAEMRALTDLKEPSKDNKKICSDCLNNLCTDCKSSIMSSAGKSNNEIYEESLNNLNAENLMGINLEFRSRSGGSGWKFHDRFLLFPNTENEPLVWSLGTSINSLGTDHHILQKVSDGQLIIDAFSELWEQLSARQCLIWKSNDN